MSYLELGEDSGIVFTVELRDGDGNDCRLLLDEVEWARFKAGIDAWLAIQPRD
jgi:hypothetical protein